jgi:hypothetical protein
MRTHRRGLETFRRDFVMDRIGWDFDVTRSTLLQNVIQDFIECLGPGRIGDGRDGTQ